jgi:hypothetical protein
MVGIKCNFIVNYSLLFFNIFPEIAMKKVFILITIFALCQALHAQGRTFVDAPFAVGGGFITSWFLPDMGAINQAGKGLGVPELAKSGFVGTGGAGYVYIGFIKGLRVGGLGIGGSTQQSAVVNGYLNKLIYHSAFGGLTIEYSLPYFRKYAISAGLIIGAGSSSIEIAHHKGVFDWQNVWNDAAAGVSADSYSRVLKSSYFLLAPTVNADFVLSRVVSCRVGAGYSFPLFPGWTLDDAQDLHNVPSKANGGGLFITAGVLVGFFTF